MRDFAALKKRLGTERAKKVYYAGVHANGKSMTLYVTDARAVADCSELLKNETDIKVKTTGSLKLEKTRSLEEFLGRIPHQRILFDPTATVERSKALVNIIKDARKEFGSVLKGCYFNSETRTIHFTVNADHTDQLHEKLESIFIEHSKNLSRLFAFGMTLSSREPQGCVVAIDKQSVKAESIGSVMKTMLHKLKLPLLVASATGMGMAAPAMAQGNTTNNSNATKPHQTHTYRHSVSVAEPIDPPVTSGFYVPIDREPFGLPAMAAPNGWLGGTIGGWHNRFLGSGYSAVAEGMLGLPFGQWFGGQLNVRDGSIIHTNVLIADGYLFWREPAYGMIGAHYEYFNFADLYVNLYGVRGDAYWRNFTFTLEGGWANTNRNGGTGYGDAVANYYLNPNLRVSLGYLNIGGQYAIEGGAEYQLCLSALPGLSIFADGGGGSNNLRYGYLGLRFYFGDNKTLVRRHREDVVASNFDLVAFEVHRERSRPRFHS